MSAVITAADRHCMCAHIIVAVIVTAAVAVVLTASTDAVAQTAVSHRLTSIEWHARAATEYAVITA